MMFVHAMQGLPSSATQVGVSSSTTWRTMANSDRITGDLQVALTLRASVGVNCNNREAAV